MADIEVPNNSRDLLNDYWALAHHFMRDHKGSEVADGSIPAAPNSAVFSATRKGCMEIKNPIAIYDYGMANPHIFALTFGTAMPNMKELEAEFWEACVNELQLDPKVFADSWYLSVKCGDDKTLYIRRNHGTAFIGIYFKVR